MEEHKKNIKALCSGHLNHDKVLRAYKLPPDPGSLDDHSKLPTVTAPRRDRRVRCASPPVHLTRNLSPRSDTDSIGEVFLPEPHPFRTLSSVADRAIGNADRYSWSIHHDGSVPRRRAGLPEVRERVPSLPEFSKSLEDDVEEQLSGARSTPQTFDRLMMYATSWDKIIDQCKSASSVLQMIKDGYEAYLSILLQHSVSDSHRELQPSSSLNETLSKAPGKEDLDKSLSRLRKLEAYAWCLLAENTRLRKVVEEEQAICAKETAVYRREKEQMKKRTRPRQRAPILTEGPKTLQFERLYAELWPLVEKRKKLKERQRVDLVSCERMHELQKSIKSCKKELHRLKHVTTATESGLKEQERQLKQLLLDNGCHASDVLQLWTWLMNF